MDKGGGLSLKMEVYKANGFHSEVHGLPQDLDVALEGARQHNE